MTKTDFNRMTTHCHRVDTGQKASTTHRPIFSLGRGKKKTEKHR